MKHPPSPFAVPASPGSSPSPHSTIPSFPSSILPSSPHSLLPPSRSALPLLLLALLLAPLPARAGFVYETPTEFHATGDFDGDSRTDVLVLDRATGVCRFGYLNADLSLEWPLPRASGIEDVTGLSVGHLFSTNLDAVAVAAPAANRVNVLSFVSRHSAATPLAAYPAGIGPQTPVVVDVGGPGNNPFDDLLVSSVLNSPNPYVGAFLRSPALTNFYDYPAPSPMARADPVRMDPARVPFVAYVDRTPGAGLKVLDLTNAIPMRAVFISNLNASCDYAAASFGTNLFNFLVYVPGSNVLASYRIAKTPTNYVVASTNAFNLANPIAQVFVARSAATNRVLVVFQGPLGAQLYDHDGAALLAPRQTLPAAGGSYLALESAASNLLVHLSADPVSGQTTNALSLAWNGTQFVAAASTPLPPPGPLAGKANVLLYRGEPFVAHNPERLAAWRFGDWSAAALTSVFVRVESATDQGPAAGLGAPATSLVARPPAATHALGNQPTNPFSIFCADPAAGTDVPALVVSPPPGLYNTSILVAMSNAAALPIHYRLDASSPWTPYTNAFYLFKDTTLHAYAGSTNSAAAPLAAIAAAERSSVFDQIAVPRPYDGIASQTVYAVTSTAVSACSLGGGLLGNEPVLRTNVHAGTTHSNSARFSGLAIEAPLLFAVATEPNFGVNTPGATKGKRIGRELLAILPSPAPAAPSIPHAYSNGVLSAEASNWIAAANAALVATSRPVAVAHLSPTNTLAALLFERKVADVLRARGHFTNALVTLFPSRTADATLLAPTLDEIASVETPASPTQTAYRLQAILAGITNQLRTNNTVQVTRLRTLARDVYSASSRYNDQTNAMLPLPATALREFIATGALDPAYTNYVRWTSAQFGSAYTGAVSILQSIPSRPLRALPNLAVRSNSFDAGQSILFDETGTPWNLRRPDSTPYPFTSAFTLLPGTLFDALGYEDAPPVDGPGTPFEVVSLLLSALPPAERGAEQLLPDEWQRLLFGRTGIDPFDDDDHDGYSNLEEYLARTDANNSAEAPAVPPADLSNLEIAFAIEDAALLRFHWSWPAPYLPDFSFALEESASIHGPYLNRATAHSATNQTLPLSTNPASFYRLRLQLK